MLAENIATETTSAAKQLLRDATIIFGETVEENDQLPKAYVAARFLLEDLLDLNCEIASVSISARGNTIHLSKPLHWRKFHKLPTNAFPACVAWREASGSASSITWMPD